MVESILSFRAVLSMLRRSCDVRRRGVALRGGGAGECIWDMFLS
jgi:hypothetical protein